MRDDGRVSRPVLFAWQISAAHFTSVLSSLSCCVRPQPAQVGTETGGRQLGIYGGNTECAFRTFT